MAENNGKFVSVSSIYRFLQLLLAAAIFSIPLISGYMTLRERLTKIEITLTIINAKTEESAKRIEEIKEKLNKMEGAREVYRNRRNRDGVDN